MHDGVMADADGHTCMMGMHDGVLKYSSTAVYLLIISAARGIAILLIN